MDEKTSRNYFNRYQHGGLASLLEDDYTGAAPKLTEQQIKAAKGENDPLYFAGRHPSPAQQYPVLRLDQDGAGERAEGQLRPYSPNLILIERYWKFFKKKVLNNQYHETFAEFKRACKSFFRKRKAYQPELKTLLTENFHIRTA